MAPENSHPAKGDSYWKPSFLGAKMLVSGSVLGCPRKLVNG